MENNFENIPVDELQFKIDNELLDKFIHDDESLGIDEMTEAEKNGTTVAVVGREHGQPSHSALMNIIQSFKPRLIIHEGSFDNPQQKKYSDTMVNCVSFGIQALIGSEARGLPMGQRVILPETYVTDAHDLGDGDVVPLLVSINELLPDLSPIIRYMGHADDKLTTLGGWALQRAVDKNTESETLIESEAQRIIQREMIMMDDVSRIIANTRRKLSLESMPKLNVLVISGMFHSTFIHDGIVAAGLMEANEKYLIAHKGRTINLYDTMDMLGLPADKMLLEKVRDIRAT